MGAVLHYDKEIPEQGYLFDRSPFITKINVGGRARRHSGLGGLAKPQSCLIGPAPVSCLRAMR